MTNKEFLYNKPLELSLPTKEANAFRKILKKAQESFVLEIKEEKGIKPGGVQYYNFEVVCPTTGFANAYFHIGIKYCQQVLPIWNKRHMNSKQISVNQLLQPVTVIRPEPKVIKMG